MAIACGGIDHPVSGMHPRLEQAVSEVNRGGKGEGVGDGHGARCLIHPIRQCFWSSGGVLEMGVRMEKIDMSECQMGVC